MAIIAFATAFVIALAAGLVFLGVSVILASRESIDDRLAAFAPAPLSEQEVESARASAPRRSRLLSTQAFAANIATSLARANLALTVTEYLLFHVASMAGLFVLGFLLTRQPLFALLISLGGYFLPGFYVSQRQQKRLVAFQQQLPDVLTLLVGSLRSGYGLGIAMDTVAKQMPPPAAEEFSRVIREIGLGTSTTQALNNLVRRIRSDDLDLMVTAIGVQYEVGGNLATILETITETIRERVRLQGQLRALTTQSTMTRYILTGLPLVLGFVMYLINPKYMMGLFTPGLTLAIPIGSAVLLVIGYFVMGKLSQIEV